MKKLMVFLIISLSFNLFSQQNDFTEFYDNGNIKQQVVAVGDNVVLVKKYDEKGQLIETGMRKNGLKDKSWVSYDDKGNVAVIGNFENGLREGTWLVFDEHGKVKYEITYEKNRVISSVDWQKSGTVAAKIK
jgi:antitoxin component YwqK of YwqJK toxin-antitoxin module